MATSRISHLPQEQALDLHRRLLDGDPLAPSDLAVTYRECLAVWLHQHNQRAGAGGADYG